MMKNNNAWSYFFYSFKDLQFNNQIIRCNISDTLKEKLTLRIIIIVEYLLYLDEIFVLKFTLLIRYCMIVLL